MTYQRYGQEHISRAIEAFITGVHNQGADELRALMEAVTAGRYKAPAMPQTGEVWHLNGVEYVVTDQGYGLEPKTGKLNTGLSKKAIGKGKLVSYTLTDFMAGKFVLPETEAPAEPKQAAQA